jgi:hypothetical protein
LARDGRAIPAAFTEDWLAGSAVIPRTLRPDTRRGSTDGNYRATNAVNSPPSDDNSPRLAAEPSL